jgi:hypothetical protein
VEGAEEAEEAEEAEGAEGVEEVWVRNNLIFLLLLVSLVFLVSRC